MEMPGTETTLQRKYRDKGLMPSVLQALGLSRHPATPTTARACLGPLESLGKLRPRGWHRVIQDWRSLCQQRCQADAQHHPCRPGCVCTRVWCVCAWFRHHQRGHSESQSLCRVGEPPAGTGPLVREQVGGPLPQWGGQPPPRRKQKAWAGRKVGCKVRFYVES